MVDGAGNHDQWAAMRDMTRSPAIGGRRLAGIIWLFAGIVVCIVMLASYSISILSAGRAYVGGEGLWSKGQKDAVYHLTRYAQRREDRDYADYQRAIAVPLGDRAARLELEKAQPDLGIARDGFLRGRNHADDVDGMIELFRRFRNVSFMDKAIGIWTRADALIAQLVTQADALHAEIVSARPDEARIRDVLEKIAAINSELTPLEDDFSYTLGEAARITQALLLVGLFVAAALLLVIGVLLSRRIVAQSEAAQEAVRESEIHLGKVIQSAPVPFVMSRIADAVIVFANARAVEQFKSPAASLPGKPVAHLYADGGDCASHLEAAGRDGALRDREVRLKDAGGTEFWALVSSQAVAYGGEPCILTSINNIDARKRDEEAMHRLAYHDGLTKLPNRTMLFENMKQSLARVQRRGATLTILFIDLDRFKQINDTLGHDAGDALLREIAARLVESVRASDLVARFGGDEFVVLLEADREPEVVTTVARKILDALGQTVMLDGRSVRVTASIGISTYPDDGMDIEALIRNADLAMYRAKENGRDNFQFHAAKPDTDRRGAATAASGRGFPGA